jgi:glycosyltransferase involved in cell wall biosynthesis
MSRRLSIVIPALDEAARIGAVLQRLQAMRARGVEVIVVDGGSGDATVAITEPLADAVIGAAPRPPRHGSPPPAAARPKCSSWASARKYFICRKSTARLPFLILRRYQICKIWYWTV